jgi:hypothetical protein
MKITIHCSATKNGEPVSVETIDKWHKAKKFRRSTAMCKTFNPHLPHIGYHWFIGLDGTPYSGRSLAEVGAHVYGANKGNIGICLAGGLEKVGRYSLAQWNTLQTIVEDLVHTYQIAENDVLGHRDHSPDLDGDGVIEPFEWLKTCPGFDVQDWVKHGFTPRAEHCLGY